MKQKGLSTYERIQVTLSGNAFLMRKAASRISQPGRKYGQVEQPIKESPFWEMICKVGTLGRDTWWYTGGDSFSG